MTKTLFIIVTRMSGKSDDEFDYYANDNKVVLMIYENGKTQSFTSDELDNGTGPGSPSLLYVRGKKDGYYAAYKKFISKINCDDIIVGYHRGTKLDQNPALVELGKILPDGKIAVKSEYTLGDHAETYQHNPVYKLGCNLKKMSAEDVISVLLWEAKEYLLKGHFAYLNAMAMLCQGYLNNGIDSRKYTHNIAWWEPVFRMEQIYENTPIRKSIDLFLKNDLTNQYIPLDRALSSLFTKRQIEMLKKQDIQDVLDGLNPVLQSR